MCGEVFDECDTLTEVDGFSECLDCLINLDYLATKATQAAAYFESDEAKSPRHPNHLIYISRAMDRAADVVEACVRSIWMPARIQNLMRL